MLVEQLQEEKGMPFVYQTWDEEVDTPFRDQTDECLNIHLKINEIVKGRRGRLEYENLSFARYLKVKKTQTVEEVQLLIYLLIRPNLFKLCNN